MFTVFAWPVFTVFTASAFMYFVFSAFVEGRNVLQNTALLGWGVWCCYCSGLYFASTHGPYGVQDMRWGGLYAAAALSRRSAMKYSARHSCVCRWSCGWRMVTFLAAPGSA